MFPQVRESEIVTVLEEQYGISVARAGAMDVAAAERVLRDELVGQDAAAASIVRTLRTLSIRHGNESKPLGVLLFAGPPGVGKTLSAECLNRGLFGDQEGSELCRVNMSELKERHELLRLTGAPPGFIGHENAGVLFRFLENHPQVSVPEILTPPFPEILAPP